MSIDERRNKFVTLAENRVNKAIKQIRTIGNLSNKSNYTYKDTDVAKIIGALNGEIRTLKIKFGSGGGGKDPKFKL